MSLTPEQWQFGRDLRADVLRTQDGHIRGHVSYGHVLNAYAAWQSWTLLHADAIIDATQPTCGRCDGVGRLRDQPDHCPPWYATVSDCPDCDGSGWAT